MLGNVKMSGVSTARGVKYAKIHRYLADIMESDFCICEAGCGSGLITLELLLTTGIDKAVLLDVNLNILKSAKELFKKFERKLEHVDILFEVGDVQNLPHKDGSFDIVFNEGVIEHVKDMRKAVKEMVRVSRKYIVIFIPNYYNPLWRILKRMKRMRGKWEFDKYGIEKDITHRQVVKWLKEEGCGEINLLELGCMKRDLLFPKTMKSYIGIIAVKGRGDEG